ncbi:3-isopropylmalate/(R)-2-methylmalate dehydratase small subunit [Kroppenstedtia sanguinis]|uniref:3-isopropylmalate dehydratase small subunit n=1 Tax=Kroppenstedtia sanguinis TaxID=1380684 RepID=A0ABW4CBQ9_9BACL
MRAFKKHTGEVVPLDRANVDTDQIIPKQFLKRVERTGFGKYLFYNWRFDDQGELIPDFVLNREEYQAGSILLTRSNFGCGSSREHAPWSLHDYGFRALIAPSFADIFYNNCFKNGILPIRLPEETVDHLFERVVAGTTRTLTVDLETEQIHDDNGWVISFAVEPHRRHFLLEGLDDIAVTLLQEEKIRAYEKNLPPFYSIQTGTTV